MRVLARAHAGVQRRGRAPSRPAPVRRSSVPAPSGAAGAVLSMQQQAGNQAVVALLGGRAGVARAGPGKAGGAFESIAKIDAMTLGDFDTYAKGIVDWSLDTALPADRKKSLTNVLEFARAGDPKPVDACGRIPLKSLEGSKLTPDIRSKLRAYTRAASGTDSAGSDDTDDLAQAMKLGDGLVKLEAHIPKRTLRHTMGETEKGRTQLAALLDKGEVDRFGRYVARSGAYLEADSGRDIRSYLEMIEFEKKHPDEYIGKLPRVHNYHRFNAPMLDRLMQNEKDHTRKKPLLLIIHSGTDHNGAFHRDDQMTALVTHDRNNTIMVEGEASLDAAGADAAKIAKEYGQNKRIQQLMLAGHGGPTSLELTGKPDKQGNFPTSGELHTQLNRARTEKFLKGLMKHMEDGPDTRILLNACLTSADEINTPLDPDPVKARAQVQAALKNDPNITQLIKNAAPKSATVEGNVSSVPAGKYMEEVGGVPTGQMHQIIPTDPHAGTSDRAEYVEFGREAEGCLRAALALWGEKGTAAMVDAMDKRLNREKKPAGWDPNLINILYEMVKDQPDNAARIQTLANDVARGLSEFDHPEEMTPANATAVGLLPKADEDKLWGRMYALAPAVGKLAIDQVWMNRTPARQTEFMKGLDAIATLEKAEHHLDLGELAVSLPKLLPVADAKKATAAQMKLAIWAAARVATPDPAAVAFLKANAVGTKLTLPAGTTVDGLTGSIGETKVLQAIGLVPKDDGGGGGGGGEPPNFDLDGDGVDDIFIRSITRRGMVTARFLNVREKPDAASTRLDAVRAGQRLEVFGVVGDWFAVAHKGRTAFVHSAWVRAAKVS